MKFVRIAAILVAGTTAITSCDKNNNDSPSTLSRIQAKWGVQNIQIDYSGSEGGDTAYTGVAADYLDFRSDNKVYSQVDGEKDTMAYSLINNNTLLVDGDTTKIQQLTSNQFVIIETTVEEGDTLKLTYNLKK